MTEIYGSENIRRVFRNFTSESHRNRTRWSRDWTSLQPPPLFNFRLSYGPEVLQKAVEDPRLSREGVVSDSGGGGCLSSVTVTTEV